MHRRLSARRPTVTVNPEVKPITLEQINTIRMLETNNDKLQIEALLPYSLFLTIGVPTLATHLLAHGGPLHFVTESIQDHLALHEQKHISSPEQLREERINSYKDNYAEYENLIAELQKIAANLGLKTSDEPENWLPALAKKMDGVALENKLALKNKFSHILNHLRLAVPVPELDKFRVSRVTEQITIGGKNYFRQTMELSENFLQQSFQFMSKILLKAGSKFKFLLSPAGLKTIVVPHWDAPAFNAAMETQKVLGALVTMTGLVAKPFIIDRTLLKFYKRYFSNQQSLKDYELYKLTETEAKAYIKQLESIGHKLSNDALLWSQLSRFFLIIIGFNFLIKLVDNQKFSPEFIVFTIATFCTALADFYKYAQRKYELHRFDKIIQPIQHSLQLTVQNCKQNPWSIEILETVDRLHGERSIYSRYWIFHAKAYGQLSAGTLCKIIKNALLKNGIEIAHEGIRTLYLRADCGITMTKAFAINEQIHLSLKALELIKNLSHTIKLLQKEMNAEVLKIPTSDTKGIPLVQYKIIIPDDYKLVCTEERLKLIFPENKVSVRDGVITIEGVSPPVEEHLEILLKEIKRIRIDNLKNKDVIDETMTPSESKLEMPDATTQEKINRKRTASKSLAPVETETKTEVQWRGKKYDLNSKDCELKPLKSRFLKGTALGKMCLFWDPRLTPAHFPTTACYEKFKTEIDAPRMASREKNAQGCILTDDWVRDYNNKFFHSTLKIKRLGIYGDARAYAEKVLSDDGNTEIYVVKGFDPHTH